MLGGGDLELEVGQVLGELAGEGEGVGKAWVDAHAGDSEPVHAGEDVWEEHESGARVDGGVELMVPPRIVLAVPGREVEPDVPVVTFPVRVDPGDVVRGECLVDVTKVEAAGGFAA